jgi:hypothetical protein
MIDFDKFKYRVGDRIHKIQHTPSTITPTEYEIVEIDSKYKYFYKIKNLSPGCVDLPFWQSKYVIHNLFEPCNPAIKLLFGKKEEIVLNTGSYSIGVGGVYRDLMVDRAELAQPDSHSLDALRYLTGNLPPNKVSR